MSDVTQSSDPIPGPVAEAEPNVWPGRFTHFLGLDWATEHHVVCVVDRQGGVALRLDFTDTVAGWKLLEEKLTALAARNRICATIETSRGVVVEKMIQAGLAVYPIRPVAAKSYRLRKAPNGVKDDLLDAWSMADALRTDGHAWRMLQPEDPLLVELRLLCRDEVHLIEKHTACINELAAALREYYPVVLEAFDVLTLKCLPLFLKRYPKPEALAKAGKKSWKSFMDNHQLTNAKTSQKRLEIFARATEWSASPAVVRAKSMLVVALAEQLETINRMLDEYAKRIEEVFNSHPSAHLFGSLPGAGDKVGPRLLASIGDISKFADAGELQAYAGTAPVTSRSGKSGSVKMRRACDMMLRSTVRFLAMFSMQNCEWAKEYCKTKRETKGYETALRCLGQRWVKILWHMLKENKPYDEARHTRDQVRYGQWKLTMGSSVEPKPA
jgi:transposase